MPTDEVRFRLVSTGLMLVLGSLFTSVASLLFSILVATTNDDDPSPAIFASSALGWLSSILEIIGQILCASVPAKAGATWLIRGVIAITASGIALGLASEVVTTEDRSRWLVFPAGVCYVAGSLLFLVFLGRLASFLGDARSLEKARFLFFGSVAMLAAIFAVWISNPARATFATMPLVIGFVIFGTYLSLAYGILLNTIRRDVDRALTEDGLG